MLLEEMQARLKTEKIETQEQLWQINTAYCLLDFDKDDFCKLIDAIGLDKWIEKQEYFKRIDHAVNELKAKECYLKAIARREEIRNELGSLEKVINQYEDNVRRIFVSKYEV